MTGSRKHGWAGLCLLVLALVAATAGGCERGDVLAPTDASITLTATPSDVNPPSGDEFATVTIDARVFGAAGFPESNVEVTFTTTGGQLNSGGAPIRTDGNGLARDFLVIRAADAPVPPVTFTVTATSGSISSTVVVTVGCPNTAPVASFTVSPLLPVWDDTSNSVTVTLTSTSTDADGDLLTLDWDCDTAVTTDVDPGSGTVVTCTYTTTDPTVGQTFTASLEVTDDDPICSRSATGTVSIVVSAAP